MGPPTASFVSDGREKKAHHPNLVKPLPSFRVDLIPNGNKEKQDTSTLSTTPACVCQVDYEPSFKLAPRWADVLEAISAGAVDLNPASGSSDDSSELSGSMSAVSDQDPKLLFPTDHHLGSGGLEGEGSDASATAASDARTAAVAAAANAKGAARHQRALGGLKTQAAMGGER